MSCVSVYRSFESAPFLYGLEHGRPGANLTYHVHPRAQGSMLFADQEYDAALVSPLTYARDASEMSIVPAVGISTIDATNSIRLVFKKGLHHISHISIPEHRELEWILTAIVLSEKYDMRPAVSEFRGDWTETFEGCADAVLLVGDDALSHHASFDSSIDLIDEWIDMTGLPFVHAIWAMWNTRSSASLVEELQNAAVSGVKQLDEIAQHESQRLSLPLDVIRQQYSCVDYSLDEEKVHALSGFFRMAFYHGHWRDIPDINVWQPSS